MHSPPARQYCVQWAPPATILLQELHMQRKDAIRTIKERLNIVDIVRRYVELKRNGPRWMAPCPFHQETKPSFSVNEEEGLFY